MCVENNNGGTFKDVLLCCSFEKGSPVKSRFDQFIGVENDNRCPANIEGKYVAIPVKTANMKLKTVL